MFTENTFFSIDYVELTITMVCVYQNVVLSLNNASIYRSLYILILSENLTL